MSANAFPENLEDRAERPDPRVERSRAKLLAAATDLLIESGARALTVDNVAERSGVAKSTLYRHWPSRTALMVDVLRSNMPCTPTIDPAVGFEPCLREYVRVLGESFANPEWARILPALLELKSQLPEIDHLTDHDLEEKIGALAELLEQGAREGLIPSDLDPQTVASMLVGPMMMCTLMGEPEAARTTGEFALERFLASFRG